MSEKIPQADIDRVKGRLNIKEVIGTDVVWTATARSYGGTFKGPCYFCGGVDRFHCHPQVGNWWCRQCDRKGDIFGYWMARYNVSFSEAYRALALAAGLSVDPLGPEVQPAAAPAAAAESATDSPGLSPVAPGFPLTIRWPDGSEEILYTAAMLRYAVHTRTLLQTALDLGGEVSSAGPVEQLF